MDNQDDYTQGWPDDGEVAVSPPHAPEAERATLGTMLQDPLAITVALDSRRLAVDEFFLPQHRIIYGAILAQTEAGDKADYFTVAEYLRREHLLKKVGGEAYLQKLVDLRATVAHVESYVRDIQDAASKRWMSEQLSKLQKLSLNGVSPSEIQRQFEKTQIELAEKLSGNHQKRQRFTLIAAPEFKNRPKPNYLLDGILVEGSLSALVAPSATYKSFIALSIAACVATGTAWHGRAVQKHPVVYISGEGSAGMGHRQRAWEIANNALLPDDFYFLPEAAQFHTPTEITELISVIKALPKSPGLIVVDTLARCLVGGDENSARDMGMFIAGADRLRAETGANVLIIHHFGKDNKTRGSSALPGALDTSMSIKREGDFLTLSCDKQKDAEQFDPIIFQRRVVQLDEDGFETSLVFDPTNTPNARAGLNPKMIEMRDVLRNAERALRSNEWMELVFAQTEIKRRTFFVYKEQLLEAGEVFQTGALFLVPEKHDN